MKIQRELSPARQIAFATIIFLSGSSTAALADLSGALGEVGGAIGGTVGGVVDEVGDVVGGVGDSLNGADNGGNGGLGDVVGGAVGGGVGDGLDGVVDGVGDILNGGAGSSPGNGTPSSPSSAAVGSFANGGNGGDDGTPPATDLQCTFGGNSSAFNGYTVVDRRGNPLGIIHDAQVNTGLVPERVQFLANGNITGERICMEYSGNRITIQGGNVRIPVSQSAVAQSYANR